MAFPATIKGEGLILETIRQILADGYFGVLELFLDQRRRRARASWRGVGST